MQQDTRSNPDTEVTIIDDGDSRKYWTQIPNIVFMLGLSPFELTLYAYFKKVAGVGGACWQKTSTLAKATSMSGGMISKAKIELSKPRPELNGKPLILITEGANRHGGKPRHVIRLSDIWPENFAMFAKPATAGPISPHEIANSQGEIAISPHEIKNNPVEEKPYEEKHTHTGAALAPDAASIPAQPERVCVSESKFSKKDLTRYAKNQSHIQNPTGWVSKAHRTGDWDDDVQDWFEREGVQPESGEVGAETDGVAGRSQSSSTGAAQINSEDCPDCHGLGFVYPDSKNLSAGVKKCHHLALRPVAA